MPHRTRKLTTGGLFLAFIMWTAGAATGASVVKTGPLPTPKGKVVFSVGGSINNTNADGAALFDMAMLKSLPHAQLDTHTSVTDGVHHFEGFLIRDLLRRVGATGKTAVASALNKYLISIPVSDFYNYDVIAAYSMDGEPLKPFNKGPLWIIYPRDQHEKLQDIRYDYRWVWQLTRLDIQ